MFHIRRHSEFRKLGWEKRCVCGAVCYGSAGPARRQQVGCLKAKEFEAKKASKIWTVEKTKPRSSSNISLRRSRWKEQANTKTNRQRETVDKRVPAYCTGDNKDAA